MKKILSIIIFLGFIGITNLFGQACPFPTNIVATQISGTSITVDWAGSATGNFQVRFAPVGSPLASAAITTITSKPYTITGLSSNTSYQIQLRDSCGATNFSFWSVTSNIRTLCQVNAPFTTNFDGGAWSAPTGFPNPSPLGGINICWSRDPNSSTTNPSAAWVVGPPFNTFNTGAAVDHTSGSGKYMFVDNIGFGGTTPRSVELESPGYDLSTITNPQLVFWYHMFGSDIEDLNVFISTDGGQSYTSVATISGQQQTSDLDAWKEQIISLSAYANQIVRIKFEAFEATPGFSNAICLDDVQLRAAPSCPRPQNLNLVSVNSASASIGFSSGGASNWNLQYGFTNFSLGTGTVVNSSTNPANISGLTPNTTYDVYVRDSCGPGDVSVWEGPLTFTTACVPVTAPYTENFDGSVFNPGTGFNAVGTISNCWFRTLGNLYFWKAGPPNFIPTGTGPQNDNTTGSGQYLFTESTGFSASSITATLESPLIDLTPLTTPELTFYVHMFGGDIDDLTISIDNGTGFTVVNTQTGQQQSGKTDNWKEIIVNLSAYANDTIKVKFEGGRSGGFRSDIAIDDLNIDEAPSCPKPQNLSLNSVSINSASLSWTSGGASNWQFSYGAPSFSPSSGTIVSSNSNPGTLSGLSANTTYEVYVRDSCGPGDVSAWAGPVTVQTRCLPVAAPYTENFDGSAFTIGTFNNLGNYPSCWRRPLTSNYEWSVEDGNNFGFNTGPIADHTSGSGKYIYAQALFSAGPQSSTEAIVTSVLVDLSPLTIPEMSFWYHMFGNQIDSLAVYIDNGSAKTRVFGLAGQQQTSSNAAWQEAIVNLSAFANDTIAVEFRAYRTNQSGNQNETSIDDLSIYEQPSCPKPQNLTSTGNTPNSVTLGWTTGGASNWRVEYGPNGFTQGNGTIVNATTNPYTVTGLSSSTAFDFYVQDSCGVGDVSFWTGPFTTRTACAPVAAPILENFDGSSFTQSQFFFDPGSIDPCWTRSDTTNYFWRVNQGPSPIFNSGPSADNTTGSGKYLLSLGNNGTSTTLTSLQIDLSPISSPELRFFTHTFGQNIDDLTVDVWDGNTWTTELTLTGQNQTSQTDPWTENIVSLQSYLNDTIQVRFVAQRLPNFSQNAAISIDDFEIRQAPTCPKPNALASTIATGNSITLNWSTGGATNWQVRYRPAASTGAFTVVNTASNPFTLTGLNPSTTYEIEVRDSCGLNDVSLYSNPLQASTLCGVVTAPYFENFDGPSWVVGTGFQNQGNQVDPCWSRPSSANPNFGPSTGPTGTPGTGPNQDESGNGKFIYGERSGGASGSGEITSPEILVPNTLVNPQLKFSYYMYGSGITSLQVRISANGGSFNLLTTISGQQQLGNFDTWKQDSIDLSNFTNDTLQIRFIANANGIQGDIAIDEVSVDGQLVPCAPITNLSLQNPTTTSLEVSWTSPNTNATVNIGYYDITAGPTTASTVSGVGSPYTIPNLLAGTTYVVAVFDSCGSATAIPELDTLATLACSPVNNLNIQNPTINSLEVSWNTPNINATVNVSYYDITAGPTTATTVSGVGSPYTIPNLIAGTSYVVAVFDSCGSAVGTPQLDTLATSPCTAVTANFTSNANFLGLSLNSTALNADSLQWDFAGLGASTQQNPNFNFPAAGTYTVTLRAFNDCGNGDTTTQTFTLCDTLRAAFTFTTAGDSISYDASSSTNTLGYIWDLDEGQTSTVVDPSVKYTTTGQKTVTLTVYNSCGDTITTTQAVDVCAPPVAQWTYNILSPINSGLRIQFDGTSSVGAASYAWDFGDGNTDTGPQPIHIYSTPGLFYVVELTVTNTCGAISKRKFALNQLSAQEIDLDDGLELYPNPATAEVNLEWNAQNIEPQSVRIISLNGAAQKDVLIDNATSGNQTINLSDLASGLYIVRVNHSRGVEQFKLRIN